jgi:hypothetical protein
MESVSPWAQIRHHDRSLDRGPLRVRHVDIAVSDQCPLQALGWLRHSTLADGLLLGKCSVHSEKS